MLIVKMTIDRNQVKCFMVIRALFSPDRRTSGQCLDGFMVANSEQLSNGPGFQASVLLIDLMPPNSKTLWKAHSKPNRIKTTYNGSKQQNQAMEKLVLVSILRSINTFQREQWVSYYILKKTDCFTICLDYCSTHSIGLTLKNTWKSRTVA